MKIIFASKFYYRRGGLESYMFKTKDLLESHGHEVIPFSTNFNLNDKSKYSSYFCTYYNLSKEGFLKQRTIINSKATKNMFFNREAYGNMKKLIENIKPDIVQGFGVTKHLSYSIFKAAKDLGVPTVMRLSDFALMCPNSIASDSSGKLCPEITCAQHNITNIWKKKCIHNSRMASIIGALEVNFHLLFSTYKNYVDYFIAPSNFLRDTFIQRYHISPDRIVYLPIFEFPEDIVGDISDEGYFIYAGRLINEKGVMTLLRALRKSAKFKLIIAGTGPYEKKYIKYARDNNLNVIFTGHIEFERLRELIRKCRAVIVPSECFENSPNIVLEGYSHNKPVIGSRIGGIPELIDENQTGLLYESGNVEELLKCMELLNNDVQLASKMGKKSKTFLESRFTSSRHYDALATFYNSVVKKKVLIVNNFYYNRGGDCTYTMALKKLLEKKGHNTIIFSMNHPKNFESLWSRHFVDYINYDEEVKKINLRSALRVATRTIFFLQAKKMIKKLIKEEKPDIAHLQNIHHHITPSVLYSLKKYKIPVVWTLHDYQLICPNISFLANGHICERCKKHKYYWPPIVRCKKRSLAASLMSSIEIIMHSLMGIDRLVNTYIAPSNFLKNKFIEFGYDENKINQISHFVELEAETGTAAQQDYYLFIGRVTEEKGIKTLIDAALKVNSSKLKIIGNGPVLEELTQYAQSRDKTNIIEFIGHKEREEVFNLLKLCKFLVIPSEWYETSGLVIIEAFACGKPVIGSRIGGIPELIKDGHTGLTYEMGNAEDLSLKIEYMLNNPDEVARMGKNARAFVQEDLNDEKHYEKLVSIYGRN